MTAAGEPPTIQGVATAPDRDWVVTRLLVLAAARGLAAAPTPVGLEVVPRHRRPRVEVRLDLAVDLVEGYIAVVGRFEDPSAPARARTRRLARIGLAGVLALVAGALLVSDVLLAPAVATLGVTAAMWVWGAFDRANLRADTEALTGYAAACRAEDWFEPT